jgi:hypothetical protein
VDSSGNIGQVATSGAEIGFVYEVQTTPEVDTATMNNEILPKVGVAMVNFVVPTVFPGQCADALVGDAVRRRKLQQAGPIVGMSTSPDDVVDPTGKHMDG